jgi:2-keto-3-deoxy-L-rhamnonate aldolase RhmA
MIGLLRTVAGTPAQAIVRPPWNDMVMVKRVMDAGAMSLLFPFVQSADGEESFVRRDSLQIKGQGMIGLGRLPEQGSPQTIRFNCEET